VSKLVINSYAKVNLYLAVVNKRRDNYHNIKTLFERISLSDKITLSSRRDNLIKISCSDPRVPKGRSNLCFKSAELLRRNFGVKKGVDIRIAKRIPVAAGLGGGSSNAASVLFGLNKLWKLNLSRGKLVNLAKKIGADVPFFIYQTPFALGLERGDKIRPIRRIEKTRLWHILVVPDFKVSTPLIYAKWDELNRRKSCCKSCGSGLTTPEFDVNILTSVLGKKSPSLAGEILYNGLEDSAAGIYPEINRIKEKLVSLGAKTILMSGSGPAVFGVVSSRKEALILRRKIKRASGSWQVYAIKTF